MPLTPEHMVILRKVRKRADPGSVAKAITALELMGLVVDVVKEGRKTIGVDYTVPGVGLIEVRKPDSYRKLPADYVTAPALARRGEEGQERAQAAQKWIISRASELLGLEDPSLRADLPQRARDYRKDFTIRTCPVCFRDIKAGARDHGRMAHHGYTIEGRDYSGWGGWRAGACPGTAKRPWEVSPRAAGDLITSLLLESTALANRLADLKTPEKVEKLQVGSPGSKTVLTPKDGRRWQAALKSETRRATRALNDLWDGGFQSIPWFRWAVRNWKGPYPTGEPAVGPPIGGPDLTKDSTDFAGKPAVLDPDWQPGDTVPSSTSVEQEAADFLLFLDTVPEYAPLLTYLRDEVAGRRFMLDYIEQARQRGVRKPVDTGGQAGEEAEPLDQGLSQAELLDLAAAHLINLPDVAGWAAVNPFDTFEITASRPLEDLLLDWYGDPGTQGAVTDLFGLPEAERTELYRGVLKQVYEKVRSGAQTSAQVPVQVPVQAPAAPWFTTGWEEAAKAYSVDPGSLAEELDDNRIQAVFDEAIEAWEGTEHLDTRGPKQYAAAYAAVAEQLRQLRPDLADDITETQNRGQAEVRKEYEEGRVEQVQDALEWAEQTLQEARKLWQSGLEAEAKENLDWLTEILRSPPSEARAWLEQVGANTAMMQQRLTDTDLEAARQQVWETIAFDYTTLCESIDCTPLRYHGPVPDTQGGFAFDSTSQVVKPVPVGVARAGEVIRVAKVIDAWELTGGSPGAMSVPFRVPHYTVSAVGLVGHGAADGELQLARTGILLLDELESFSLEAIRALQDARPGEPVLIVYIGEDGPALDARLSILGAGSGGREGRKAQDFTAREAGEARGYAAFAEGRTSAPYHDPSLQKAYTEGPPPTVTYLEGWSTGWNAANAAAAVPEESETTSTTYRGWRVGDRFQVDGSTGTVTGLSPKRYLVWVRWDEPSGPPGDQITEQALQPGIMRHLDGSAPVESHLPPIRNISTSGPPEPPPSDDQVDQGQDWVDQGWNTFGNERKWKRSDQVVRIQEGTDGWYTTAVEGAQIVQRTGPSSRGEAEDVAAEYQRSFPTSAVPPLPPMAPVQTTLDSYGKSTIKAVPRGAYAYKLGGGADTPTAQAAMKAQGWQVLKSRGSYTHAISPGGEKLPYLRLKAEAPSEEDFNAWADAVHIYFRAHPNLLSRSRYGPRRIVEVTPTLAWAYMGENEYTVGSSETRQSGARLTLFVASGTMERGWPYGQDLGGKTSEARILRSQPTTRTSSAPGSDTWQSDSYGTVKIVEGAEGRRATWHNIQCTRGCPDRHGFGFNGSRWARRQEPPVGLKQEVVAHGWGHLFGWGAPPPTTETLRVGPRGLSLINAAARGLVESLPTAHLTGDGTADFIAWAGAQAMKGAQDFDYAALVALFKGSQQQEARKALAAAIQEVGVPGDQEQPTAKAVPEVAGIVFTRPGQILLVHPTSARWWGTYSIPKGHVEPGETKLEAALRETLEEVGIDLAPVLEARGSGVLQGPFTAEKTAASGREQKVLTYWVYDAAASSAIRLPSTLPKSQLQAAEVDWAGFVDLEQARKRLTPYMRSALEHVPPVEQTYKGRSGTYAGGEELHPIEIVSEPDSAGMVIIRQVNSGISKKVQVNDARLTLNVGTETPLVDRLRAAFTPDVMAAFSEWFKAHGFADYVPVGSDGISTTGKSQGVVTWTNGKGRFEITVQASQSGPGIKLKPHYHNRGTTYTRRQSVEVPDSLTVWARSSAAPEILFDPEWFFDGIYPSLPDVMERLPVKQCLPVKQRQITWAMEQLQNGSLHVVEPRKAPRVSEAPKLVEVGVTFGPDLTAEQTDKLFKAQQLLNEVGVTFDTGYSFGDRSRDWEWDWSLKGPVKVKFKRFVGDNVERLDAGSGWDAEDGEITEPPVRIGGG